MSRQLSLKLSEAVTIGDVNLPFSCCLAKEWMGSPTRESTGRKDFRGFGPKASSM